MVEPVSLLHLRDFYHGNSHGKLQAAGKTSRINIYHSIGGVLYVWIS